MPDTLSSGNKLFADSALAHEFDLNGYVVIPFFDQQQVDHLKLIYSTTNSDSSGFYSTSFIKEEEERKKISCSIEAVFKEKVKGTFREIKSLGACFLVKQPGPEGQMPIHQDWTVVNEPEFDSVTIWVPLQDVDENNGAIEVLPGSHRFSDLLRSPSLPNPFGEVEDEIRKEMRLLRMKAGEAFIFSHALLHASPANATNAPRVAATFGLVAANADLKFYHYSGNGEVETYAVDNNFFQNYNTQIGERPKNGELINTRSYSPRMISSTEFAAMRKQYIFKRAMTNYKMKSIFKEQSRQTFFEKEGYLVMPLLSASEVSELKGYYEGLHLKDEKGFGFHVSMDQADKEMCRQTRDKVWSVALPALSTHLKDFKPFVASYVVKEVNPKGVVPAHQDWSFAAGEEDGCASITCWIALVDTNLDNGCMGVIKGSHRFMQNHRPSPSPQCPVPLSNHMFSIFPYLHTIEMKAGEVLFFDNRTFHASPPNTSDGIRLAVGVGVTQADAQLVHYYLKPDGTNRTMLRYNVDEDFYLRYDNATLSKMFEEKKMIEGYGEPEEVPYAFPEYSSDELVELIKEAGNEYNIPMTEKLAKLFGYLDQQKTEAAEEQKTQQEAVAAPPQETQKEWVWVDDRTFFEKYTPLNIVREIKKRLVGV